MTQLVADTAASEAQAYLEQHNIYLEMADAQRLVLITTPNDEPVWYEQLLKRSRHYPSARRTNGRTTGKKCDLPRMSSA
ncbi:MAG: hypothetical protein R2912_04960 [Eubacteriales bacterium]